MQRAKPIHLFVFLLPAALLFALVFAIPMGTVLSTALTDWSLRGPTQFIGLQNFGELFFDDAVFTDAFVNTLKWIFLSCTVHVALGVAVALLTQRPTPIGRFVKVVYLIPNVISISALAMLFYFIFHTTIGPVNALIRLLGFADFNKSWYFEADTAFMAVTMTTILFAGIITLLISAQISAIPISLYEAAEIDGATRFDCATRITLPLIKGAVGTGMILAASGSLKAFEVIFLTSGGGPGTLTMNLPVYLYNQFMRSDRYGYGNAIGVMILLLGVASMLAIRGLFREENVW